MKILVYGAGVLGSLLAHVLHRGGNDVTLLARGKRLDDLQKNGLVIQHYLQLRTTTDIIRLVEQMSPEEEYDLCFIVMQRQQLDDVLPVISASTVCQDFVLVGNNPEASETAAWIQKASPVKKRIAFGFQASGGRREKDRVISIYRGKGYMTVGNLENDKSYDQKIRQAFSKTKYHLEFSEDMDAWLKCHAAFIIPIVFACYYADGDLRRVAWNSNFLNRTIDAIEDAYRVVKAAGYPIMPPDDDNFLARDRSKIYWMLKLMAATPIGKLTASDHAMSATAEMHRLYDAFCLLKKKAGIETPAWDEMSVYMKKY